MQIKRSTYLRALQQCAVQLEDLNGALGTERVIRDAIASVLPGARTEELLSKYSGIAPDGATKARVDIVVDGHGVELKVVRMPRVNRNSPNGSLYDLGQIANDYLKLASAKNLESGELIILVYGPLIEDIGEKSLYRELHNRMFTDYSTSRMYGELQPDAIAECDEDWKRNMRKLQLRAIRKIGFDKPCDEPKRCMVVQHGALALVSIPVAK